MEFDDMEAQGFIGRHGVPERRSGVFSLFIRRIGTLPGDDYAISYLMMDDGLDKTWYS